MPDRFVRAVPLEQLERLGRMVVQLDGQGVALFADGGRVFAVDKRCPHMGFPLERGSLADGILTCHWHHARFDLTSGGTFDLWADDLRAFPTDVRDGDVWVDLTPRGDPVHHQLGRLRDGLEQDIPLVVAKAVIHLLAAGVEPTEPFRAGLNFGTRYSVWGWGSGLTELTAFMNLLPVITAADRPRALYHGLAAVAEDTHEDPPRFEIGALPPPAGNVATLKRYYRRFVEVRDFEGAERCIASALEAGAGPEQMADLLFAAATDHRYLDNGHVVDFTNKAFEALDVAGWDYAPQVLPSLVRRVATAARMEEDNAWRHPVDLVALCEAAFEELPHALAAGARAQAEPDEAAVVDVLLGDDPAAATRALLDALAAGTPAAALAQSVCHAAVMRIARFHTSNEFPDWDTALHTLSFANAVHAGLVRTASPDLVRGVFDAAMSVYLDRFLNIPAAPLPSSAPEGRDVEAILEELPGLLDAQHQITRAGEAVAHFLAEGGESRRLIEVLGRLLLREDRDFHTIQAVEACVRQHRRRPDTPQGVTALIAAARYLAAHAPTMRAQGQTYQIAARLFRGEALHEPDDLPATAGRGLVRD